MSNRHGHSSVVHDGKIWVIGGAHDTAVSTIYMNSVHYSSNGESWTEATASANWTARHGHTSVVHDGKMWVIGGATGYMSYKNDVWHSPNGVNWTQATPSANWSARLGHTSVVHGGKIWVIGGYDGTYKNDVWYSSDGVQWTQASASAPWAARYDHTSVVDDGKIWVIRRH